MHARMLIWSLKDNTQFVIKKQQFWSQPTFGGPTQQPKWHQFYFTGGCWMNQNHCCFILHVRWVGEVGKWVAAAGFDALPVLLLVSEVKKEAVGSSCPWIYPPPLTYTHPLVSLLFYMPVVSSSLCPFNFLFITQLALVVFITQQP